MNNNKNRAKNGEINETGANSRFIKNERQGKNSGADAGAGQNARRQKEKPVKIL